jgi:Flp pilus assembly pilin Flp
MRREREAGMIETLVLATIAVMFIVAVVRLIAALIGAYTEWVRNKTWRSIWRGRR